MDCRFNICVAVVCDMDTVLYYKSKHTWTVTLWYCYYSLCLCLCVCLSVSLSPPLSLFISLALLRLCLSLCFSLSVRLSLSPFSPSLSLSLFPYVFVLVFAYFHGLVLSTLLISRFLPSTRHENNIAQPKPDKCLRSSSHCSPFNCCLSIVL